MLRTAAIVLGLVVLGIFAVLPSAAATPQPATRAAPAPDLSSLSKIKSYLRSLGADPRTVVIQRGARNYAGPNCPGAAWTCTDAKRVVQLGAQNTFECSAGTNTNTPAGFQECLIVQGPATRNVAKCNQKSSQEPFVRQRCSITQTGRNNEAIVAQLADQSSGGSQQLGALQEVGLLQTGTGTTGIKNRLQVNQEIKQLSETTTAGTQDQDAYQVVGAPFMTGTSSGDEPAQQIAEGRGDNTSQIVQRQTQRAKGGTTQLQNDGLYAPPAPFGGEPTDCHEEDIISPDQPNACVNFEQEGDNGSKQQSQLTQSIDMEETTTAALAIQRQHPGEFQGGADGRIHQDIDGSSGSSQNQANQSERLKMLAPSDADQEQHGGAGCCGFGSQEGGTGNSEQINQQKDLDAVGGTIQTATLVGSSRSPDGNCAINHNAATNSDSESESASQRPCFGLFVVTTCSEGDFGSEENGGGACNDTDVVTCEEGEIPIVLEEYYGSEVVCVPEGEIGFAPTLRAFDRR
jgi:hypothetical protein